MTITATVWIGLIMSAFFAYVVFGEICCKVGYSRWLSLVMVIPFLNVIALLIFAYSTWPIESKLMEAELRNSREEG